MRTAAAVRPRRLPSPGRLPGLGRLQSVRSLPRERRLPRLPSPRRLPRLVVPLLVAALLLPAASPAYPAGARTIAAALERLTAIEPGSVDRTSLEIEARYDVAARLSFGDRTLRADVEIELVNRSDDPIDRVELNTIAARLGALRLGGVTVDGTTVDPTVDDQTVVVPLGGTLAPDAGATVRIAFSARLRSDLRGSNWMFTRVNGIASLYRWIPWVSRRTPFDRPNFGDPFVTPASPLISVRLTTDRALDVAATGERVGGSDDGRTHVFRAENVRDFILTAAADYRERRDRVNGTLVRAWSRASGQGPAMLTAARTALRRMEALVGPYPWSELDVAQSSGRFGMEGPGIVWIPTGVDPGTIPYLVAHEVAHEWFYGLVGSDQAREPFADEAAADFLARYVLGARRGSRCSPQPLDRSIYRYGSACYYEIVYIQGGNVLDDIRRRMGTTRFFGALRTYLEANRFGIAGTRTLLDTLDAATSLDLRARYASRFPSLD